MADYFKGRNEGWKRKILAEQLSLHSPQIPIRCDGDEEFVFDHLVDLETEGLANDENVLKPI
jgi:hypothetical protein